jgi:hypothetical protein
MVKQLALGLQQQFSNITLSVLIEVATSSLRVFTLIMLVSKVLEGCEAGTQKRRNTSQGEGGGARRLL